MDLSTFLELFTWPLVSLLLAAVCAPLVGVFLFARGASFHGIVLPQIATFGVALGYALAPLLGPISGHVEDHGFLDPSRAYLFTWAGLATATGLALLLGTSSQRARHAGWTSARVAAAFAIASGGTVIASQLSPEGGLQVAALLSGETLATGALDALLLAVTCASTLGLVALGWRELTLAGHDPGFARAIDARPAAWDRWLHATVGLVVMIGSLTVGPLPLFALLVLPPIAARGGARSMRGFLIAAPLLGVCGATLGALLSFLADLPMGASVVAGCAALAAATALWRKLAKVPA